MIRMPAVALGLGLMTALAMPGFTQEKQPFPRTLNLSGHGEVKAVPDMAMVTLGMVSHAGSARKALAANTQAMTAILKTLKDAGIAEKDIQTSNFSVQPSYQTSQSGEAPKINGYEVSNNVTFAVRKLDSLGQVLDEVIQQGSNQVNGVQFMLAEPEQKRDEARKLAAADAERKARLYAETAGFALGQVISLSETGGFQPPVPVYAKAMRAEAADTVPIAQGEQTVAADVNITWEIKDRP
jgi:uncharacterized protein